MTAPRWLVSYWLQMRREFLIQEIHNFSSFMHFVDGMIYKPTGLFLRIKQTSCYSPAEVAFKCPFSTFPNGCHHDFVFNISDWSQIFSGMSIIL